MVTKSRDPQITENIHLFSGETFPKEEKSDNSSFSHTTDEIDEKYQKDNEINQKYQKGEIRIITEQARYPLFSITDMIDSQKYILNPEYQRRKRWDNARKSLLIESFIMNVPIPPVFLYEINYSIYEVMDGQQRLTAIYDFYKGNFDLEGLEHWRELNGRSYADLPAQVRKGIDRRYLSSVVLLQETTKNKEDTDSLKKIVFERLNSGSEKLTPQETRNALYNGKFNQLCIRLAQNDSFRKMWKLPLESSGEKNLLKSERYRKMEDVELVLKFFAYRHIDNLKSTLDNFLDVYLKHANTYSDETMKDLENLFNETIDLIYNIFGKSAFVLPDREHHKYNSPTKTVYVPLMLVFANYIYYKESLIRFNDRILAFEIENYIIKKGDKIIIETAEGKFYEKTIETIQLDNVEYPSLEIMEKTNIAVSVEPKIKKNQTFYIAKQ